MHEGVITATIRKQREYFMSGKTWGRSFRIRMLRRLRDALKDREDRILLSLYKDLGKSEFEAYETEVGLIYAAIEFQIRHIRSWMRPRKVRTPFTLMPAVSRIHSEPYGVALIVSPWNYPLLLLVEPLIGAIAAGNCVVLKPSELAPQTSSTLNELIRETFDPEYVALFEGGREMAREILKEKMDYIFFSGSQEVGRSIMQLAAVHLTPVTLELGGKSPCIVTSRADLSAASRRIIWGKFLNAGQTCIAPDYVLAERCIKDELVKRMIGRIEEFYGEDPKKSPDYPRIVSERHFDRLLPLLEGGRVLCGGEFDPIERYMAPTILDLIKPAHPVMQEEIFGPILPVLDYDRLDEAIAFIRERPKPLSLYVFTNDPKEWTELLKRTSAGGVGINATVLQIANPHLPFGGVGPSGMGSYHGKASFEAFSHKKSVINKCVRFEVPLPYPPFKGKLKLLRRLIG
jgi:acyl-CoA reductase-like NAD-dependent aldehyde dehydrogenase